MSLLGTVALVKILVNGGDGVPRQRPHHARNAGDSEERLKGGNRIARGRTKDAVGRDGGDAAKISNPVSQVAVHKLRAQSDAILVGRHTALLDNPSLDIRHWAGRSPLRLVIDRGGTLPSGLKMFDGAFRTLVYTAREKDGKFGKNVEQVVLDFNLPLLPQILSHLSGIKVNSLLVEGGATLLQSFIDASLWDEVRVEVNSSLELGNGVVAPSFDLQRPCEREIVAGNEILHFYRQKTP